MRSQSHLNTSLRIIQTYDGILPLSAWLKNFFSAEKKYGSKDRKQIAHYCYCYYRLGKAFENKSKEEKLMLGAFLSSTSPPELLQDLRPDWNERIGDTLADKINFLSAQEEMNQIFFLTEELSKEIEKEKFQQSFLVQPDLFLRIRPGKEKLLKEKLTAAGIDFYQPGPDALGMSNQTKLEAV
ncbi:MAG: Fmu (Sun) domain-containing protein, partial [Flavisolibacter sp.]